jgi:hypothetical protein
MASYGQIRSRVVKECPGVDLTLIDGYLTDRYTAILDKLHWARQKTQYIFQTAAPYATGTLTLTNGMNTVALAGGTFTSAMNGQTLLVGGRSEPYVFTFVGATSGTLDRPFDGPTLSTYTFELVQSIYALPSTTRAFESVRLLDNDIELDIKTRAELNRSLAARPGLALPVTSGAAVPFVGSPEICALAIDSNTNPPQMQIELVPAPDNVYSIAVDLVSEASTSTGTVPPSATSLLPWVRPACLTAFAVADAFAHLKDWESSEYWKGEGNTYLADMARTEISNAGPLQMTMGSYYTSHRRKRGCR